MVINTSLFVDTKYVVKINEKSVEYVVMRPSRSGLEKVKIVGLALVVAISMPLSASAALVAPEPEAVPEPEAESVSSDPIIEMLPDLDHKGGEVIVEFKDETQEAKKSEVKEQAGIEKTIKEIGPPGETAIELVQVKSDQSPDQAVEKLNASADVEVASLNYIRKTTLTPNDPSFGTQWGLNNTGQTIKGQTGVSGADIDATNAWDITTGTAAPAAVIDSGIDAAHPDLASKLWQNTDEIAGNGLDDDGNGYVDDRNGYNMAGISQWSANVGISFADDADYRAQSIKGTGQPLTHIGLYLRRNGSPSASITISVRETLGGPNLSTATFAPGDVSSSYNEVYKALSAPVTLTSGQTYYIVLQPTATNASNFYYIAENRSGYYGYVADPYKDGTKHTYNGSSWSGVANDDLYFRTNPNANPRDENGHGTHVSGIIGAQGNNGIGVSGVSQGATIMALKAGDCSGYLTDSAIIEALYYAADNGALTINMSFGGSSFGAGQQAAATYAYNSGSVLFAASGNSGSSSMQYPAGYSNVIGVGATTNRDTKASFSTYNSSVDLSAPGQYVNSTMPTYAVGLNSYGYAQNYDYLSGTSMATPMAAGAAMLVRSVNPSLTPAQVEQYMEDNADDLGTAGRDDSFGHGRVNAYQVLGNIAAVSGNISIDSGAANTKTTAVTLSLSATSTEGAVTDMRFRNDGGAWSAWEPYATTKSWTMDSGSGTKRVWVQYRDDQSNLSPTASDTITLDATAPSVTMTAPAYSTDVSRTRTFRVYWAINDPAPSSGLGSYNVQYKVEKDGGWRNWQTNTTKNSALFKGRQGRTYYFRGQATDGVGNTGNYSGLKRTIVPYDNNTLITKKNGFDHNFKKSGSRYYKGTVRYSTRTGDNVTYKFTGDRWALISTKNRNRSMAIIYVDGKYKRIISTYSSTPKYRQVVFAQRFKKRSPHRVTIVNIGNRARLDTDAIAVGR
ncbi:MAG TPA: hypothetical protein ENI11_06605 [Actinobacteria bacterium]|nr:hypothetical protein [Actinomycetota bacterium]